MNIIGTKRSVKLLMLAFFFAMPIQSFTQEENPTITLEEAKVGKMLFEGSKRLENGGPSCIVCHSINSNDVIPGGLYGVELTDAYQKYSVGLSAWLGSPNIPAMEASYQNHPMTEMEREELAVFLQYVLENKDTQSASDGYMMLSLGGLGGLAIILIVVSILWNKRKKETVNRKVFMRQTGAADAKY